MRSQGWGRVGAKVGSSPARSSEEDESAQGQAQDEVSGSLRVAALPATVPGR